MDIFLEILSLVGSLVLFLYGMKIMSEGLEKYAGDKLRSILAAMTRNRVMGVLTGILITALIQSSSATTVMVVSFVNAGMMTLKQSIGVIMGANVGTTVTAWIISAVGFKVNIAAFSLPLMALGLPLFFSKQSKRKSIGEFVFGFSFLFMGLSYLQVAATNLNIGEAVASMLAHMPFDSFWTILIFVLVGALVTMIVQASAATMAITLMLFDMHIPGFGFEQAAALAMGQNIGTTITAFMASLTANTSARRAAMAHMFFNVFGVLVVLLIFYPACNFVGWIVTDVLGAENNDLFKLSAFHTAFNIFNTLLLIGFVPQIERLVCKLLPQKEQEEEYRLKYISAGLLSTSELSVLEAQKEINNFAERCLKMIGFVRNLTDATTEEDFNKYFAKIEKYEGITDNMEVEIANYLSKVGEGRLSNESKIQIQRMMRLIPELESIGDSCYNLARTLGRRRRYAKEDFNDDQSRRMHIMLDLAEKAVDGMVKVVARSQALESVDYNVPLNTEHEINNYRKQLRNQNIADVNDGVYSYQMGVFYIDYINECEKLGDYVMNVVEATKTTIIK